MPYPKGILNKSNTTFVRGINDYTYGNKDYSYIQLRPSTGQLTIDITGTDYFFSYSMDVKKDLLYERTLREYTFGESYDRSNGLSEMGSMSNKLALGSLTIPVAGEAAFGIFTLGGKVLSGVGDGTEIVIDLLYGKKKEGLGKIGFSF